MIIMTAIRASFVRVATVHGMGSATHHLSRLKQRERHLVGHGLERDPDGHADAQVFRRAADDVGHEPRSLLQFDQGHDVGGEVFERAREVLADDGEAVDGAPAAGFDPVDLASAAEAPPPGVELVVATRAAALHEQAAVVGGLPVGLCLRVHARRRPRLRRALLAQGASLPRIRVAPVESMPPVPWATATRASSTWFTDWPRSWRTASTIRNMPRMPGWQADSPPPSVFVGRSPPTCRRPPSTKAPPSPLAQKPRSSRLNSTV